MGTIFTIDIDMTMKGNQSYHAVKQAGEITTCYMLHGDAWICTTANWPFQSYIAYVSVNKHLTLPFSHTQQFSSSQF